MKGAILMKISLKKLQTTLAAILCVATLGLGTMAPAKADGAASTRNIIFGALAVAAGAIVASNVSHKNAQANTVTGYTSSGATVYNDGHVVMPDGQSYYPGNYGQSVACNSGNCTITGGSSDAPYSSYSYNGYGPYAYNGLASRYRR